MDKEQKLKIVELVDKKTQKAIAEELGVPLKDVRAFIKQLKASPASVVAELVAVPPQEEPELQLPSIMDMITQKVKQSGKESNVVIMNEGVAVLNPKRSSNSSKYKDFIFKPR